MPRKRRFPAARVQKSIHHAGSPTAPSRRERAMESIASSLADRSPRRQQQPTNGDPRSAAIVPTIPAPQTKAAKTASSQYVAARRRESWPRPPPAATAQSPAAGRSRAARVARAAASEPRPPARRTTTPLRSVRKPGAELQAQCRTATPRQTTVDLASAKNMHRCVAASASPESPRRFECATQCPGPPADDSTTAPPAATRKER